MFTPVHSGRPGGEISGQQGTRSRPLAGGSQHEETLIATLGTARAIPTSWISCKPRTKVMTLCSESGPRCLI